MVICIGDDSLSGYFSLSFVVHNKLHIAVSAIFFIPVNRRRRLFTKNRLRMIYDLENGVFAMFSSQLCVKSLISRYHLSLILEAITFIMLTTHAFSLKVSCSEQIVVASSKRAFETSLSA
uniref:Uncharacterized protein n=1 Tax=Parascaris univalens TaxID=6257 RepID=A0A915AVH2_PARUN